MVWGEGTLEEAASQSALLPRGETLDTWGGVCSRKKKREYKLIGRRTTVLHWTTVLQRTTLLQGGYSQFGTLCFLYLMSSEFIISYIEIT